MKLPQELFDRACDLLEAEIVDGKELNNPVPVVLATGLNRPLTLAQQIDRILHHRLSREASRQGFETLEESEDFDIDDDFNSDLPYTVHEMADEVLTEAKNRPPAPPASSDQPNEASVQPSASEGPKQTQTELPLPSPPNQPSSSGADGSG